jgi:hypothetical protein
MCTMVRVVIALNLAAAGDHLELSELLNSP